MPNDGVSILLRQRDRETLRLLSFSPLTAPLILKGSTSFMLPEQEQPYKDERRVRERLQRLEEARLVRSAQTAWDGRTVVNYYRLTHEGFRTANSSHARFPVKSFFEPIALSRLEHTSRLAELIVHALVSAHRHRIRLAQFIRENEFKMTETGKPSSPDAFMEFRSSGRIFNLMVELDNGTEPLVGDARNTIETKLKAYEAHQDYAFRLWHDRGKPARMNPRFRAVFLTKTAERAEHIAQLAAETARNKDRRLCYTATLDSVLAEPDALRAPIFLDHQGHWRSLVNCHPTSCSRKTPVRLALC